MNILMKRLLLIGAAAMLSLQTNAQEFDPTFDNDGWRQDTIGTGFQGYNDVLVQPDNKVVAVGTYFIDNFTEDVSVARYNVDGSLDNSFGTNGNVKLITSPEGITEVRVARATTGDIYILANRPYGGGAFYIYKMNVNGSLDNSFGTNGIIKDSILTGSQTGFEGARDIAVQADGKMLVAGYYHRATPTTEHAAWVIRFNTDGTRDNGFGTNGMATVLGGDNKFNKLLIQPDGKILAGGCSGLIAQQQQDWLVARFNTDGTLDNSFGAVVIGMQYEEEVKDMALQSDGSVIIGGACGNGNVTFRIIKLTANGLNDPNFGTDVTTTTNWGYTAIELQTFTDHGVGGLAVLPDDKIILGGVASNKFVAIRFNADGDPDNTFGLNSIADSIFAGSYGFSMASTAFNEATGRFYAVGAVLDQNEGITYSNVAAFLVATPNSVKEVAGTKKLSIYPNPVSSVLHMDSIEGNILIQDISGRTMLSVQGKDIDVSGLSTGMYFINCITKDGSKYTGQFVKN